MLNFFRLAWRMLRLFRHPEDSSPIGALGAFTRHKSVRHCMDTLRSKPEIAALMAERYLAPQPTPIEELAKLPLGTLGREYVLFLERFNLKPDYFPSIKPSQDPSSDDTTWMRMRGRETHDLWHLVTGFDATQIGEMGISAFYIAQLNSPLNAVLIAIGFMVVVIKHPTRLEELMETIVQGWSMGRRAKPLFAVKWEQQWARPLSEIRLELGLLTSDETTKTKPRSEASKIVNARDEYSDLRQAPRLTDEEQTQSGLDHPINAQPGPGIALSRSV